jgi:hypothetical protein
MSERQHLLDKYDSINKRFNEHKDRLEALTLEKKFDIQPNEFGMPSIKKSIPRAAFKSLVTDLVSFWNEMSKLNDQAIRRTGQPIEKHMDNIEWWRKWLRDQLDYSRQSGTVL